MCVHVYMHICVHVWCSVSLHAYAESGFLLESCVKAYVNKHGQLTSGSIPEDNVSLSFETINSL